MKPFKKHFKKYFKKYFQPKGNLFKAEISRLILVVFLAGLFILGVYLAKEDFLQPAEPEQPKVVHSSASDNVTGWAWGGGDDTTPNNPQAGNGWISFNCTNTSCASSDYGVNINSTTGNFEGYAWVGGGEEGGSNVPMLGWISFNRNACSDTGKVCINNGNCTSPATCITSAGNPPAAPYNTGIASDPIANVDFATGQVRGWMRVLANGGNWDGWIKLGGDTGGVWPTYGGEQVSINLTTSPKEFCGWAWGSDVVGWISFNIQCSRVCDTNPVDGRVDSPAPAGCLPVGTDLTLLPEAGADINFSPRKADLNPQSVLDCCEDSRHPKLSWTYSDPENDLQAAYQIQIDVEGSSDFISPLKLDITADTDSPTYTVKQVDILVGGDLNWNTTYYWRVQVKDSAGNWSDWSSVVSFKTPPHPYPDVHFSYAPNQPSARENVSFRDTSKCYDSTTYIDGRDCSTTFGDSYVWTFTRIEGSGTVNWDLDKGDATTLEFPVVSFSDPSKWEVKLKVTDGSAEAYSCETPPPYEIIIIREPLPWWKEIIPRL